MIESWGRGFDKIKEECENSNTPLPEYEISERGIMVLCKPGEKYLKLLKKYGLGTKEGIKDTPQVTPQVDARFKYLMEICIEPKSREEMQHAMNLKDKKNFVKNYIKPMIENGLIVMTIPEKPQSQNQRYKTNDIYVATEVIDGKEIRKLKDI